MKMNWPKEMEEALVTDERLAAGKSRFADNPAFFYEGKEIAHFQSEGLDIRLGEAGIYALQKRLVEDCVLTVTKDWVLLRVDSEQDLKFASAILDRAIRESIDANPKPTGKKTRKLAAGKKSEAMRGFSEARALKELAGIETDACAKKISKSKKRKS